MQTKNPYHNIYAVTHRKSHDGFIFLFCFLLLGVVLFWMAHSQFVSFFELEGIYECSSVCTLRTVIPYSIAKSLSTEDHILLNDQELALKVKEFGSVEVVGTRAFQNILLEVPKQNYYSKETVSLKLIQGKKSLLKIIYETLKGGDAK